MIAHTIPEAVPEMALDKYLRRAWPLIPGHVLKSLFKKKDVRLNGLRADPKAPVRGGDSLTLYADAKWFEPLPDILWTDDKLIVAVKPQGLPVDVDRDGVGADTLLTRLQRQYPAARLCHRLDAATGGIVLAAAEDAVAEQALEAFRAHALRKEYHALALHPFDRPQGVLNAWLLKDARRAEVKVLHRPAPGAKPIETRYRAGDAATPGVYHAWLNPVTGRTHQLRAHLADAGHPLLGDDKYGDRTANKQYPGAPLCLWHERLFIPMDSPLLAYQGQTFTLPAPDWASSFKL